MLHSILKAYSWYAAIVFAFVLREIQPSSMVCKYQILIKIDKMLTLHIVHIQFEFDID